MEYKIIKAEPLEDRLKRCIAFRHTQNTMSEPIRETFKVEGHPELPGLLKSMMDQASAVFCLADLAGVKVEDVILGWVQSMEQEHPEILGMNSAIEQHAVFVLQMQHAV